MGQHVPVPWAPHHVVHHIMSAQGKQGQTQPASRAHR
jgi:hypothetical protein